MRRLLLVLLFVLMLPFAAQATESVVVIGAGQSASNAIDLTKMSEGSGSFFVLHMPSAWTVASLTLQISRDNGATWRPVYDAVGSEYTIATAASRAVLLDPAAFMGARYVKFVSGTSGTPVAQASSRTIYLTHGRF